MKPKYLVYMKSQKKEAKKLLHERNVKLFKLFTVIATRSLHNEKPDYISGST
jgi:hypothetical protein